MAFTDLSGVFNFKDLLTHQNMDALAENDAVDNIPGGSVMVFFQSAAPVGWAVQTVVSDSFLRVVDGAGGGSGGDADLSTGFSDQDHGHALASHNHTLPIHSHVLVNGVVAAGRNASVPPHVVHQTGADLAVEGSAGVGNSSMANDTVTTLPDPSNSATGTLDTNTSFQNIQHIDVIVCVKGS